MKINCYLESHKGITLGVIRALQATVEELIKKYPEIQFNIVDSAIKRTEQNAFAGSASKYGAYYLTIENPNTKKYILVSYGDKMVDLKDPAAWDLENCAEIFSSIGNHKNDVEYRMQEEIISSPISYTCSSSDAEIMLNEMYHARISSGKERSYPEKLSFRGHLYLFRKHLYYDKRFDIKGELMGFDSAGQVIRIEGSRIPLREYIEELDSRALNLSLNGTGEICFRDIEILGLGTALMRPKLVTKFRNELIPNYHYISVDFSDIEQGISGYEIYCNKLADRLLERFNEVRNDKDFIDFIAANGRKWYEENGTIEANGRIAANSIDLSKII
jgi:hypothetical protein